MKNEHTHTFRHWNPISLWTAILLAAGWLPCAHLLAQDVDSRLENLPAEDFATDRDHMFRLQAGIRVTDEDEDLVDDGQEYQRCPAEMLTAEAMVFHKDGLTLALRGGIWEDEADLDLSHWQWMAGAPISSHWKFFFQHRRLDGEDRPTMDYVSVWLGVCSDHVSWYQQYRQTVEEGDSRAHQISQILAWSPNKGLQVGGKAAYAFDSAAEDDNPWYVSAFTTISLVEDQTSLQVEGRHYDSADMVEYDEIEASLNQRLGPASTARLSYRYYDDTDDFSSHAWGVKVKHHFSKGFSAHVGFKRYDHSEDEDLNTTLAGFSWLL